MVKKIIIGLGVCIGFVITCYIFVYVSVKSQHKKLSQGRLTTELVCDTIPFTYSSSGYILIEAKVNGGEETYPFILDSGASNMVFSTFTNGYHLENNGFGISIGSAENLFLTRIKEINSLQIGNIEFRELNAEETDFNFNCTENVCGIIGTGLMHHLVWQIDFNNQIIIISKYLDDLQFQDNTIEIPLHENKYSHHLSTDIKLRNNKSTKEVLIDLGSNNIFSFKESSILKDSINLRSKRIKGQISKSLGNNKNNTSDYRYYLLDSLIFSRSLYFVNNIPIGTSSKSLNLLGLGFLKKYKSTISWSDKKLILEPYDSIPDFNWKTTGFSIKYNKELKKAEIGTITENTPAARANVPLNAQVIAVNEILFSDLESYCNSRKMKLVSDTIYLKIKKGDGSVKEYPLIKEPIFQ